MKPSKETLLNSYIDVKRWSDEDVRKAAEWLAENTGMEVTEGENLTVLNDLGYHYLIADEQDNTVWVCRDGGFQVQCRTQLTDLSFMRTDNTREEPVTNTLESLKKAKQELAFAKDCLKSSQEAVEEAQKAYTDAYKAFKEEADGLLREDEETPERSSKEGSGEGCEEDYEELLAIYAPLTTVRLEDMTEGFGYEIKRVGEEYWFYDDEGDINVIRDRYSFTKLFQRTS